MDGLSLLAKHRGKADVATPLGHCEKNALQRDSKFRVVSIDDFRSVREDNNERRRRPTLQRSGSLPEEFSEQCTAALARPCRGDTMTLDPVILSRLQFFWVVSFHILLPAFTVGLACYIAVLEVLYLKTEDRTYFLISVFWTKIFAVSFGLGVVTGIVMPFQFGTNWSRFSDTASNVIGPLMAYEGLTAFFLEASFLGILLFGRKLVPPWAHCFAAVMVSSVVTVTAGPAI